MTRLFRSKSTGLAEFHPSQLGYDAKEVEDDDYDDEEEAKENGSSTTENSDENDTIYNLPISKRFIGFRKDPDRSRGSVSGQFSVADIVAAVLRKSLVTCSVERDDVASSMDISWPTDVRHVSHVTFDRFNGFLGLPTELEPDVPRPTPSASASVFGVSARSMQCSFDTRGNSVPTILLMMQKRLYAEGGLKAEGIFRINPENGQEEHVRQQLNKGVVPRGIDVHCLAGLIKAWFRELPTGVLDLLTPEQVMHCNTEDDCTRLVMLLPQTEAALLDWAINLMADVVEHEEYNKMNARNIAMVFAPNMTQMADPLTALIHAVQVMNFLKTLILKNLRERDQVVSKARFLSTCFHSSTENTYSDPSNENEEDMWGQNTDACAHEKTNKTKFLRTATLCRLEADNMGEYWNLQKKNDIDDRFKMPVSGEMGELQSECDNGERLSLREGVRRLCRHPVFQLSKPAKKARDLGIVNNQRGGGGEAWA